MKKLFLMAFLVSATFSFAQTGSEILPDGGGNNGSDLQNINSRSGFWIKSTTSNNLDGTFYLYDKWVNRAQVYVSSGKGYNIPNCNFNVKFNRFEALLDNDTKGKVFAFNTRDVTKVKIGPKTFVTKAIDQGATYLLEVIQKGEKVALYKAYNSSIIEARINPMTQEAMGNNKVDIVSSYYVEKDGNIELVKMKKSSILKLMANKKGEMKTFLKENKLSISEDADLFKIFDHYNAL
ncbi:hypothetical protein [Lacinutrix sp. MEBiC02595]